MKASSMRDDYGLIYLKEKGFIQSVALNGKPYTRSFITYNDILQGSTLQITMGAQPNKTFETAPADLPKSIIYY